MSTALRARTPDVLLDWDRVLADNLVDDFSGLRWTKTGTISRDGGPMLGGVSGAFSGSQAITMSNVPWSSNWTAITFCRMDTRTHWQKLWEFAVGNVYSDYISVSVLQPPYFDFGPDSIGAHLTPPNDTEARAFAMAYYWSGSAHMLTWLKRDNQFEMWMGRQLISSVSCQESSNKLRRIMLGNEYSFASTTGWRGGIGGFGLWRRAMSAAEIGAIWNDVRPAICNIPISARSVSADPMRYSSGYVIPLSDLRVNGMAGLGALAGTVKIQVTPTTKIPARRKVRILDTETGLLLYETWSEERTGYWRVDGLALNRFYTVLSHDHLRDYNAVTADYRLAEIMS